MLIPLLRRSRRHLVASIHPSSLSQHPALSLGSGHALSPPLHTREQHHHYCKWQLAGGDGRMRPCTDSHIILVLNGNHWLCPLTLAEKVPLISVSRTSFFTLQATVNIQEEENWALFKNCFFFYYGLMNKRVCFCFCFVFLPWAKIFWLS